jgi:hypothetical protein
LVIHVDFLSLKTGFYHHDYFSFNDGNNSWNLYFRVLFLHFDIQVYKLPKFIVTSLTQFG